MPWGHGVFGDLVGSLIVVPQGSEARDALDLSPKEGLRWMRILAQPCFVSLSVLWNVLESQQIGLGCLLWAVHIPSFFFFHIYKDLLHPQCSLQCPA
jgi:hypothetical protein